MTVKRAMTQSEIDVFQRVLTQCDDELGGQHAAPVDGSPLIHVGELRARANVEPWHSDGIGHHRGDGEPRWTDCGHGLTTRHLVGGAA